jgi:hypothetical protein
VFEEFDCGKHVVVMQWFHLPVLCTWLYSWLSWPCTGRLGIALRQPRSKAVMQDKHSYLA